MIMQVIMRYFTIMQVGESVIESVCSVIPSEPKSLNTCEEACYFKHSGASLFLAH